jgi:hypothetical protein
MMAMTTSMPAVAASAKEEDAEEERKRKEGQFTNYMVNPCVSVTSNTSACFSTQIMEKRTQHKPFQEFTTFQLHKAIPPSSNQFKSIIHPQVSSSSGQKTNEAARR